MRSWAWWEGACILFPTLHPLAPRKPLQGLQPGRRRAAWAPAFALQVGPGSQLRVPLGAQCQPEATAELGEEASGAWGWQITVLSQGQRFVALFCKQRREAPHTRGFQVSFSLFSLLQFLTLLVSLMASSEKEHVVSRLLPPGLKGRGILLAEANWQNKPP